MARLRIVGDLRKASLDLAVCRANPRLGKAGDDLQLAVTLTNTASRPIAWRADAVLNLAYRWIDESGQCVEENGRRTPLPAPLAPAATITLPMRVKEPPELGSYELVGSLVLEGVHWACDVSETGWFRTSVDFATPFFWPSELERSPGARALRGALAVTALQSQLEAIKFGPDQRRKVAVPVEEAAAQPLCVVRLPKARLWVRVRTKIRQFLGTGEIRSTLEDLRVQSAKTSAELRLVQTEIKNALAAQDKQLREIRNAIMLSQLPAQAIDASDLTKPSGKLLQPEPLRSSSRERT